MPGPTNSRILFLTNPFLKTAPHNAIATSCGPTPFFEIAAQVNGDRFRTADIVRFIENLLYKFGAAFADRHGAQRPVARVRIAAQNHAADFRFDLPHILMDDGQMRRNKIGSIFFRGGKAEHMIVLVDRTADRAERIMAVGKRIR